MWSKIKDNWNLIATVLIICVIFLWGKSCGTKEFKPEEKPVYLDSTRCNKVFLYSDSIKTKEYDIYTKAYVQGLFRNLDLKVKLKVPLMIKDCTVVKKDSLIYRPYKYEIHAGGIIGFKTLIPVIEMSINKATYGAGYDILNKSIIFTAKYRLHGWTPKSKKKK